MVVEEVAGGVIESGDGQLEIDLGLNETQLGQGQLVLSIENEEHRLGAQFVFALVGVQSFASKVFGDFGSFHGEFGLLERVDGVGDFEGDALVGTAFLVLIAAAAD
jgi:hypothetical protein